MKIFISYTSSDREWAHWIGWNLHKVGHEAFVHEWEIGAGENIPRWMEDRLGQADRLLGIFSDSYCDALYSQSERWAAYWQDPGGRSGFLVPVEVRKVTNWPVFIEPLKRLSLTDLDESEALKHLLAFLEHPKRPSEKPIFPGSAHAALPSLVPFTEGGESLSSPPPSFPPSRLVEESPQQVSAQARGQVTDVDAAIRCIDDYEPRPLLFGRRDEIETVVGTLLVGKTVLIAGGPGMGKSAVATAALRDSRIETHFGRRRVCAALETATEPRAILAKLIETLGLPPTGDEVSLLRILEANAAERPIAAILDNADTVLDIDRGEADRLLNLVAQVEGLSLAVTVRGVAPPVTGAIRIEDLPKLIAEPARDAFLAVAGESFNIDPDLPHLLEALDGHALSLRLVAAQAIGLPSLRGLRESWDEARSEILRRPGEEEGRLTSVHASLALSMNSRRMKATPLARRLMTLLAFLPGGSAESDVPCRRIRNVVGEANCILGLGEIARAHSDHETARARFEEALALYRRIGGMLGEANCIHGLGVIAGGHSDHETSRARFEEALALYRRIGDVGGEANSIRGLGEIALARSDHETARARFEAALPLYRRIGQVVGEANCILDLGEIALGRFDHETAVGRFEEALLLYRRSDDVLGEANCILKFGEIAFARSDHETARARFEEALLLYRRIGDVLGEANCIQNLGAIALARSNHETARGHFAEALVLYQTVGNKNSQAAMMI